MIFRRTKMIKSAKIAVAWARDYMDETGKHKGKDLSEMGMGIGRYYFTSRAPGHLSSHGYVRPAIAQLKLTRGMSDNEAILHYIQRHCATQQKKRRTVMAIRVIVSLDPAMVVHLAGQHMDVDELLVKATEATFKELAARYYPGQELAFFMGIHHDRMTADVVNLKMVGKATHNPARLGKPNLHAHLFLFPQTSKGRRLSVSKRNFPRGQDKPMEDMLGHCREIFSAKTKELSSEILPSFLVTRGFNAIFKLACMLALEDFQSEPELSPEHGRESIANRVVHYVSSLDREHLRRQLKARQDKIQALARGIRSAQGQTGPCGRVRIASDLATLTEQVLERVRQFAPSYQARIREIEEVRANYNEGRDRWFSPKSSFHALGDTKKATATLPLPWAASNPLPWYDFGPDRVDEVTKLCRTLRMRRKASRVSLVAEMADSETNLASVLSARGELQLPTWIKALQDSLGGLLPNQFTLVPQPVAQDEYEVSVTTMVRPPPPPTKPAPTLEMQGAQSPPLPSQGAATLDIT